MGISEHRGSSVSGLPRMSKKERAALPDRSVAPSDEPIRAQRTLAARVLPRRMSLARIPGYRDRAASTAITNRCERLSFGTLTCRRQICVRRHDRSALGWSSFHASQFVRGWRTCWWRNSPWPTKHSWRC